MENTFTRIEIIIFFISLIYVFYYIIEKFILTYVNIKKIIKPDRKILEEKAKKIKEKAIENKSKQKRKTTNTIKLSPEQNKKIKEIVKRVQINTAKWYYDTAKSLIVEWLAIDKYNKDLNLELAWIYEADKDYKKAEFIYRDLLEVQEDTFIILKKLGYNLALQRKFEESLAVFLEAHNKRKNDIETIETIADLMYELKYYKKALKFIKLFLKEHPRNTEKLKMKAYCYEVLGKNEEALEAYNRVLELQPYNSQIIEKIKHLEGL